MYPYLDSACLALQPMRRCSRPCASSCGSLQSATANPTAQRLPSSSRCAPSRGANPTACMPTAPKRRSLCNTCPEKQRRRRPATTLQRQRKPRASYFDGRRPGLTRVLCSCSRSGRSTHRSRTWRRGCPNAAYKDITMQPCNTYISQCNDVARRRRGDPDGSKRRSHPTARARVAQRHTRRRRRCGRR